MRLMFGGGRLEVPGTHTTRVYQPRPGSHLDG